MDRHFTHISHLFFISTYLNKIAHPSTYFPLEQIHGLRGLKMNQVSFEIYFIFSIKLSTEENTLLPISPKVNLLLEVIYYKWKRFSGS